MKVYRICKEEYSKDLSGRGSFLQGGRWNSPGKYMLYTSTHRSLALLELLVHVPLEIVRLGKYVLLTLEIPGSLSPMPHQFSQENYREFGNAFLDAQSYLYVQVPSIIFPEEENVLINPLQKDFEKIKFINSQALVLDQRF